MGDYTLFLKYLHDQSMGQSSYIAYSMPCVTIYEWSHRTRGEAPGGRQAD